ncbi:type 4a pilus biogenesis protein PilO [sulfur-oxidizing endosymbiont of Gigantopelta aegis]|uniref:type 4a pilus biogenesis protein PilO n=1 Tax=sulfur-oxidizing endosymbiont of Gigantopelta aegis TaxID=2794934 RepID=UPI0018DB140E|nr:type 4a pilus biogenesis protein PilO [sulfur-oxidizing endosymbiont of Gigantopelta aegis]
MNINELDFENIGSWPLGVRLIATFIVFALVLGGGFYYFTQDTMLELEKVESKEQPLKKEFKAKQGKAANLEAYKLQMVEMEKRFDSILKQLPQKTEVADLLVEISQTGLSNNLEFSLFKPSGESRKEFYAELPVNIKVTGTFHDFGGFATGIAALPRIVTIHNVSMVPIKTKKDSVLDEADKKLTITLVAKTYRYLDQDEISSTKKKSKRKRRR